MRGWERFVMQRTLELANNERRYGEPRSMYRMK